MSRLFYQVMQDNGGNLLFGVSGTMRLAGSGTLATIYGDEELTVILPNPMTNHPSFGSFKCFLGAGDYDFYMAKSGYTFETLTGVQGHGTMAQQDAASVAITGGTAALTSLGVGIAPSYPVDVYGAARFGSSVFLANVWRGAAKLELEYLRSTISAISIKPDTDSGPGQAIGFVNAASASIGSITTTGAATAYNTASDARLKEFIETLTGALDVIRALNPVSFRWQADGSKGNGFLAHELMKTIPEAVSGLPDEVNPDGSIKPQQVDHSRLVVWLVGAIQEMAQRLEIVEAQLTALTAS